MKKEEILNRYADELFFDEDIKYRTEKKMAEFRKYSDAVMKRKSNGDSFNLTPPKDNEFLVISPVRIRDYNRFFNALSCLLLDRSNLKDINLISMSYLDYLMYLIELNDEKSLMYSFMLTDLFSLCCNLTEKELYDGNFYYGKDEKQKPFISIRNVKYTKKRLFEHSRNNIFTKWNKITR